jgi:hypothetical protein
MSKHYTILYKIIILTHYPPLYLNKNNHLFIKNVNITGHNKRQGLNFQAVTTERASKTLHYITV